jgi:hypothetical protein
MQRSNTHGILWQGSSRIDGAPLVAVATDGSANPKTGPMIQVWILRADISPVEAVRIGADRSICGRCPLRAPRGGFSARGCYVQVPQAPTSVWRAFQDGKYEAVSPERFARRGIRWGAYGDPALLPAEVVHACNAHARFWTGYTHLFREPWAAWARGTFMASVETPAQEQKLRAQGWGTFRAGRRDGEDHDQALLCANEATGESCTECKLCNGEARAIVVSAHGPQAAFVPAERLRFQKSRDSARLPG